METIKGFIRYEPEMRFTTNGIAITNFLLYDTKEGEYQTKHRIVTWELLAETCDRLLQIDDEIFVKGYWKERSWTKTDGEIKTIKEFTAKQAWLFKDSKFLDITQIDSYPIQEELNGLT